MSHTKTHNNIDTAVAYYQAMNGKNVDGMAKQLHADVELVGPMDNLKGKEAVLESATKLSKMLKGINIRTKVFDADHAVLTYEMHFDEPIGICRTAAVMSFRDGLIARNELFFDTAPFKKK
ncbi:MAG: nuclear transport factor 2 family protein [Acidobacteria bacterium]|nr:nuclear transport factor 2 family protein [Acidobacteriota bacterium]